MANTTVARDFTGLPGPTPGRNPAGGYKVPNPGAGYQHRDAHPPVLVRGKSVHKRMLQVTRGFNGAAPIPRSTLVPSGKCERAGCFATPRAGLPFFNGYCSGDCKEAQGIADKERYA